MPRPALRPGCLIALAPLACLLLTLCAYLLMPGRTTVLLLGIDYVEPWSAAARTDTMIITAFDPWQPYVRMLSIPRDLWVTIPGVGQNRINTAHFYAESQNPGSGPKAALQTVAQNFGVQTPYYLRVRFESVREIVDALGGVDIVLEEPAADYPAGRHHLTGRKALAFVRHRLTSDDFHRMSNGQLMLKAIFRNMLNPLKWPRLPAVASTILRSVDTNLPLWSWPRLGMALLRVGPGGIDSRVIDREMVLPFTTDQGAMVLGPNWNAINPVVQEMFAK